MRVSGRFTALAELMVGGCVSPTAVLETIETATVSRAERRPDGRLYLYGDGCQIVVSAIEAHDLPSADYMA